MHRGVVVLLVGLFLLASCQENLVYSKFQPVSSNGWESSQPLQFEVSELDSLKNHSLFINLRNDESYPFSNLFLITEFENPNGETVKDTLEYEMARPNGEWLGTGYGSIKENKFWYKENIVFRDTGVYKIRISHAMRKNGEVAGVQSLHGITDVGLEIEKNER